MLIALRQEIGKRDTESQKLQEELRSHEKELVRRSGEVIELQEKIQSQESALEELRKKLLAAQAAPQNIDIPLSKALEVNTSDADRPQYGGYQTWQGNKYQNAVILATPVGLTSSVVTYKIPPEAKFFSTIIGPAKENCDTSGGGVNGWNVTLKTPVRENKFPFNYHAGDSKVIKIPVDDIPKGKSRVLSIIMDTEGNRTCDRAVLGEPHFVHKRIITNGL